MTSRPEFTVDEQLEIIEQDLNKALAIERKHEQAREGILIHTKLRKTKERMDDDTDTTADQRARFERIARGLLVGIFGINPDDEPNT